MLVETVRFGVSGSGGVPGLVRGCLPKDFEVALLLVQPSLVPITGELNDMSASSSRGAGDRSLGSD